CATLLSYGDSPKKTVWMNEDNQHFYDGKYHGDEDMTVEGCRKLVDTYARTGTITGILFCVNMQRALYDSNVWERFKDQPTDYSYQRHLRLLSDRGVDQFATWLQRCKELGIAGWLTMRMNDAHGLEEVAFNLPLPEHLTVTLWPSEMWRKHPEWRRAPYRQERSWEGAYNYLIPEVFEHHLKLVREIFSKWDMDGFECDWMRWAMHFPPGSEYEGRKALTRFVKEVRKIADEAEKRVGHKIKLGHRVPTDPETCLRFGYDVAAWSDAGCVDMLTLAGFGNNVPNDVPIELWRRILKKGTHINCGTSPGKSSCLYNLVSGDDLLRGGAASYWACGTDGLYLFNECYREPHRLDTLESYLKDICSAKKLTTVKRRYAVDSICAMPGYSARRMFPCPLGIRFEGYVIDRMSRNITLRLTTGPVNKDSTCTLSIAFDDKTDEKSLKEIEVRMNTQKCKFKNRIDLDLNRVDQKKAWVKLKDWPRDAKTVLQYTVPAEVIHERENAIEILPPHGAKGNIIWTDLMVE
ncbi:MAG: hypothetical protein J6V88_01640, partial [Kiritimatiellae bacterium]|nr:hypothetical protein [Kiritimatiellia bacterium]